ncbi:MAG: Pr6Pr family membrane protein [Bifidobacterium tibiigranuli]|nr:Pr6Pr family membrane protein [Bifidobacterium tibiigranuli]MCI1649531.1 Pr6Pr family membrane protein [Bifidobacterium tibiigranuli]MCI2185009.1 Pr6Pr family membrane protein [Bifidobacterium tibiigranuli]MCI2203426.1 Pr6Pr family membrane protein [Bifidobacterium tibiigranuli]
MKSRSTMRFVAGLWRLACAFLCFAATSVAWHTPNYWVYFTYQTGFVLGLVMLWAGAASLIGGKQPPAWLKGCLTFYIAVTGIVAATLLPPPDPATSKYVFGILTNTILHQAVPIIATIDFLLFDEHRRFAWHYPLTWLIYFPFYLTFVLVRAQLWPHSGPQPDGSAYPYGFIDLAQLGWAQMGKNIGFILIGFMLLGLLLFLIDRILPKKPLLG